MDGAYTV
jgi:hypothetical protein